jgi:hypothetical protein
VSGNRQARFGKRPTEKEPTQGHLAGGPLHAKGGPGKPTRREPGRAPWSDPANRSSGPVPDQGPRCSVHLARRRRDQNPVRVPVANATCERFVGCIRRELRDRILIVNAAHATLVLAEYEAHVNTHRPHRSLGQAAPLRALPSVPADPTAAEIRRDRLGGLIHEYARPRRRCGVSGTHCLPMADAGPRDHKRRPGGHPPSGKSPAKVRAYLSYRAAIPRHSVNECTPQPARCPSADGRRVPGSRDRRLPRARRG